MCTVFFMRRIRKKAGGEAQTGRITEWWFASAAMLTSQPDLRFLIFSWVIMMYQHIGKDTLTFPLNINRLRLSFLILPYYIRFLKVCKRRKRACFRLQLFCKKRTKESTAFVWTVVFRVWTEKTRMVKNTDKQKPFRHEKRPFVRKAFPSEILPDKI